MKYLLPILLLSGCAFFKSPTPVAIAPAFPEVPVAQMEKCPDLAVIDTKTDKLSDVLRVVSSNYTSYYTCAGKVSDWQDWYNAQKKIYEGLR